MERFIALADNELMYYAKNLNKLYNNYNNSSGN